MATLRDLKRRISSVKSVAHITRSMEMLSVVKIYHLRKQVEQSVPFVEKLQEMLISIANHIHADVNTGPLFESSPIEKTLLIPLTSDRGFCGSFNSNITSITRRFIEQSDVEVLLGTISKKTSKEFDKNGNKIVFSHPGMLDKVTFDNAQLIGSKIKEMYINGEIQSVNFAYMEFQSVLKQESVVRQMLPLARITKGKKRLVEDFIFKPEPAKIIDSLTNTYIDLFIYKVLLEASASEQAMRRMSMHRATENADELSEKLTIKYQRTRQASITKELTEITSSAEALKETA